MLDIHLEKIPNFIFNFSFWKNCEEFEEETGAISLDNLGGVFIVIFVGIFLAVITLGIEFCYYKKKDDFRMESAVVKISGLGEYVEKKFWLYMYFDTEMVIFIKKKILFDIFIK